MTQEQVIKTCSVENCENRFHGLGYCRKHYVRFKRHGDPLFVKIVFGEDRVKHPLYNTYHNLKDRCLNPKNKEFKNYGGRGINVCDRWLGTTGFSIFCADMGNRPTRHTIDRIDNDKGYSPENCKWATASEQNLNRRITNKHPFVCFRKSDKKWIVQKTIDGKIKYFGSYHHQADAVEATIKLGFVTK